MTEERELHMLTGAYALDAVDDLERARVRELLTYDPEAAAEVRSFTETAARLGAATAVEPPSTMRDAVLAQIRATRQAPPLNVATAAVDPAPVGARTPRWLTVAAAVLLVLALGAGTTALSFRDKASTVEQANIAMTQVLSDPDRQVLDADFAGGHATLVVSGGRVVVLGTDVAAPPQGKSYQLWMLEDDADPIPSVVLEPTGDGSYWADTSGYESGQAMAVTIEPEGGSQVPSSDPVFVTGA